MTEYRNASLYKGSLEHKNRSHVETMRIHQGPEQCTVGRNCEEQN